MSPLVENATAELYTELRHSFEEAFKAQVIKSLTVLVPGFVPADLLSYASRITVATIEGQPLKEVHLDMKGSLDSGTYLFCYSDELKVDFSEGRITASIG